MKGRSWVIIVVIIMSTLVSCDKPVTNEAPTISFSAPTNNSAFMPGETITFSMDVDDPEEDMREVRFYVNNIGLGSDLSWPYSFDWETGTLDVGEYMIKAEAIDNDGAKGEAEITITLNRGPIASFSISPDEGTIETIFSFDASAAIDAEEPTSQLRVRWDWENNGVWDTEYTLSKTVSHQFTTLGSYTVAMEVQDSWGLTDTTQRTILVTETVTDIDGNIYETIQIGEQLWMAENLKVTHYRDGTAITNVIDANAWAALPYEASSEAYCIYNNNASNEVDTYGALYNWYAAVDIHNIAPVGWHVPTDDEWKVLEMYLGMSQSQADSSGVRGTNEGSKLAGNAGLWNSGTLESDPEFGITNFMALPGGNRDITTGNYMQMGEHARFWNATDYPNNFYFGGCRDLRYQELGIFRSFNGKTDGFSIRCLKD